MFSGRILCINVSFPFLTALDDASPDLQLDKNLIVNLRPERL